MKISNGINKKTKKNRGMTYVELIVVLSIFTSMSSVLLFSYDKFQAKVDIKNLANDIALKIVEAQKSALSGKLPLSTHIPSVSPWKPAYGMYFNLSSPGDNKTFIYFVDLDQNGDYNYTSENFCTLLVGSGECLDKIGITKNNTISDITAYYQDATPPVSFSSTPAFSNLSLTFTRPNSGAIIKSTYVFSSIVSHVVITTISPSGISANIKVYASGRIQIN